MLKSFLRSVQFQVARRAFDNMSRFKSFALILTVLCANLGSKAEEANTWSLNFGGLSLFNIPQFGRSFVEAIGVVTENPLNTVDILPRGPGSNTNIPEDAHLKTVKSIRQLLSVYIVIIVIVIFV